jgi:hypothetical protein
MVKISALRNICARLEAYFEGEKGVKEDMMTRKRKEGKKHGKRGKNVSFNISA